jgi:hypothetical protein
MGEIDRRIRKEAETRRKDITREIKEELQGIRKDKKAERNLQKVIAGGSRKYDIHGKPPKDQSEESEWEDSESDLAS